MIVTDAQIEKARIAYNAVREQQRTNPGDHPSMDGPYWEDLAIYKATLVESSTCRRVAP